METTEQVPVKNGRGKANDASITVEKVKPERKMRSLPGISDASSMPVIDIKRRVNNLPSEWKDVENFSMFSLSADGSYPCVKSSRSTYIDLVREKQETSIYSGRCFLLYA
jgi:hypothetical protein